MAIYPAANQNVGICRASLRAGTTIGPALAGVRPNVFLDSRLPHCQRRRVRVALVEIDANFDRLFLAVLPIGAGHPQRHFWRRAVDVKYGRSSVAHRGFTAVGRVGGL